MLVPQYAHRMSSLNLQRAAVLALVLFCSYAYFDQGNGWNQDSRFALTRSIVEFHSLSIDHYHYNTGDKAFFEGHYYSDKAPGLALSAVPVWAVLYAWERASGKDLGLDLAGLKGLYLSTVLTVALPMAIAGAVLFLLAIRFGASVTGAAFAALVFGLANPAWCYATLFWGHAPAAAYLLFAFAAAVALSDAGAPRRDFRLGLLLGLFAGWAVVTDYTCAPIAVLLTVLALGHVRAGGWPRMRTVAAGIMITASLCAAILGAYNTLAFHSPFHLSYSFVQDFGEMRVTFFGLSLPRWDTFLAILIGQHHGLLFLSPVLAAAPLGLLMLCRNRPARRDTLVAALIVVYFVVLNSSAVALSGGGGASYGPRFLFPAVPFLCLMLAAIWTEGFGWLRAVLAALAAVSLAFALIAVSTNPMPNQLWQTPLVSFLWPAFKAGDIPIPGPARSNYGHALGLSGHASLIPLVVLWALAATAWLLLSRRASDSRLLAEH